MGKHIRFKVDRYCFDLFCHPRENGEPEKNEKNYHQTHGFPRLRE
jgi:hypothetical protein